MKQKTREGEAMHRESERQSRTVPASGLQLLLNWRGIPFALRERVYRDVYIKLHVPVTP